MSRDSHICDDQCMCPEHQTPMHWWPGGAMHACADPGCRYAHGCEPVLLEEVSAWADEVHAARAPRGAK